MSDSVVDGNLLSSRNSVPTPQVIDVVTSQLDHNSSSVTRLQVLNYTNLITVSPV